MGTGHRSHRLHSVRAIEQKSPPKHKVLALMSKVRGCNLQVFIKHTAVDNEYVKSQIYFWQICLVIFCIPPATWLFLKFVKSKFEMTCAHGLVEFGHKNNSAKFRGEKNTTFWVKISLLILCSSCNSLSWHKLKTNATYIMEKHEAWSTSALGFTLDMDPDLLGQDPLLIWPIHHPILLQLQTPTLYTSLCIVHYIVSFHVCTFRSRLQNLGIGLS